MNEVSIHEVPELIRSDLERITKEEDADTLLSELRSCLEITTEQVVKVAMIIRRLDELGVEVDVEPTMLSFVRLIAHGQLLPSLFVALQGDSCLLRRASQLSIPDQRKVAENDPIKVAEPGDADDFRTIPPLSMTRKEIRQVFCRGKIRSLSDQRKWLRDQRPTVTKQADIEDPVWVDRRRKGIVVKGHFLSAAAMAQYVAELYQ